MSLAADSKVAPMKSLAPIAGAMGEVYRGLLLGKRFGPERV